MFLEKAGVGRSLAEEFGPIGVGGGFSQGGVHTLHSFPCGAQRCGPEGETEVFPAPAPTPTLVPATAQPCLEDLSLGSR